MKKKNINEFKKYLKSVDGDQLTIEVSHAYDKRGFELLFDGIENEKRCQNERQTNKRWFDTWGDILVIANDVLSESKKRKKK